MSSQYLNLEAPGICTQIKLISVSIDDYKSIFNAIQWCDPDEVNNLSGQTSVGLSFDQPIEAIESIVISTLNILVVMLFKQIWLGKNVWEYSILLQKFHQKFLKLLYIVMLDAPL